MFNIFGAIGRMLPGYMEGERTAIKDNWNDLNQYSDVQAKQISNLFSEATFNPKVNMQYDAAAQSLMNTEQIGMQNELMQAMHPGNLEAAAITGSFQPYFAGVNALMRARYPWLAYGGGFGGMYGGMYGGDTLGTAMGYPQMSPMGAARGGGVNRPTLINGR